jgi:hypothetical protein
MLYSRTNPIKSPVSGAGNVMKPGLRYQVGRMRGHMRVDYCFSAIRAMKVLVFVCLRSSCSHVTEAGGP